MKKIKMFILLVILGALTCFVYLISFKKTEEPKIARVVANEDILMHSILYTSAKQPDGSYDFNPYFKYVKERLTDADLAIGDYEGTISPYSPLGGYPMFNAPKEIAYAMRDAGYDVVDLAHNHILDTRLKGAFSTVDTFKGLGLDTFGFYKENRDTEGLLIKDVNGIKIAILGYAYGFNGMEQTLTDEEYVKHMSDLNQEKMKLEIEKAEELADVTIVMPQMGVEYELEPTPEQVELYHKMVEWGADVIFGGHPHVIEPAETVLKDGEKKFIIYSMGNFLSDQTLERLGNKWTERGLLMDVTFEKVGDTTTIKTVKAHPTMVWAYGKGIRGQEGYEYFNYRIMVLEDFIEDGKYRNELPPKMQEKVDVAYEEIKELVNLQWEN